MIFELCEFQSGHSFFERGSDAGYPVRLQQLGVTDEKDARLVWKVEAESYEQAMQALYDRKGWGLYRRHQSDANDS